MTFTGKVLVRFSMKVFMDPAVIAWLLRPLTEGRWNPFISHGLYCMFFHSSFPPPPLVFCYPFLSGWRPSPLAVEWEWLPRLPTGGASHFSWLTEGPRCTSPQRLNEVVKHSHDISVAANTQPRLDIEWGGLPLISYRALKKKLCAR